MVCRLLPCLPGLPHVRAPRSGFWKRSLLYVVCSIHLNAMMQYLALTCGRIHVLLAAQADGAKLFERLPQLESLHGKVFSSSGESMIVNLRTFPGSRLCHRLPSTERAPSSWAGKLLASKVFRRIGKKTFPFAAQSTTRWQALEERSEDGDRQTHKNRHRHRETHRYTLKQEHIE